ERAFLQFRIECADVEKPPAGFFEVIKEIISVGIATKHDRERRSGRIDVHQREREIFNGDPLLERLVLSVSDSRDNGWSRKERRARTGLNPARAIAVRVRTPPEHVGPQITVVSQPKEIAIAAEPTAYRVRQAEPLLARAQHNGGGPERTGRQNGCAFCFERSL